MKCLHCQRPFPRRVKAEAGIAILVQGDEYYYSYWLCDACDHYTVKSYHDRFAGDDEVSFLPPVSREVGDRAVELIAACPDPNDKFCDCESHQALFYGLPQD